MWSTNSELKPRGTKRQLKVESLKSKAVSKLGHSNILKNVGMTRGKWILLWVRRERMWRFLIANYQLLITKLKRLMRKAKLHSRKLAMGAIALIVVLVMVPCTIWFTVVVGLGFVRDPLLTAGQSLKSVFLLEHGYRNTSFRLKFTLDGLVHPLSFSCWNPGFAALFTNLDRDVFKEIKMSFYQAIERGFLAVQPTTALGTQRIFHGLFSLLVLGSNHLAGSNQWTVMT